MKKILSVCIALLLAVSFGACAPKEESNTEEEKKAAGLGKGQLEEFDVVLDWYPNAVHAFLYEAIEKGYYEEEGLQVNIRFPANVNDAVSLTAAGKADIGIYYMADTIMARVNEKIPVKSVGSVLQTQLNIILSLKDKEIQSPKDLVGKQIGYSASAISEAQIKAMMEHVGADADSVTMTDVGFDLMSSMTTGNVDATIGCMVNHEVPQMEKEGFEVNYFFPKEYGVPDSYELILLAGEKQLEENPEKIERFLRATKKGFQDMKANPQEALRLLLDNQNEENFPLSESVEKASMDIILPLMETEDYGFMEQSEEIWQENIDWLYEQGLIDEAVEAADFIYK